MRIRHAVPILLLATGCAENLAPTPTPAVSDESSSQPAPDRTDFGFTLYRNQRSLTVPAGPVPTAAESRERATRAFTALLARGNTPNEAGMRRLMATLASPDGQRAYLAELGRQTTQSASSDRAAARATVEYLAGDRKILEIRRGFLRSSLDESRRGKRGRGSIVAVNGGADLYYCPDNPWAWNDSFNVTQCPNYDPYLDTTPFETQVAGTESQRLAIEAELAALEAEYMVTFMGRMGDSCAIERASYVVALAAYLRLVTEFLFKTVFRKDALSGWRLAEPLAWATAALNLAAWQYRTCLAGVAKRTR